jgi:DNA polymerase-3 subunit alpha
LLKLFGDRLYIELQRHGLAAERTVEPHLLDLAYARNIALVATNQPYFGAVDDYEAHDALISIAEGRPIADTDRRQLTPEHRFKSRRNGSAFCRSAGGIGLESVEIAERSGLGPRHARRSCRALLRTAQPRPTSRLCCGSWPKVGLSAGSPRTGVAPGPH